MCAPAWRCWYHGSRQPRGSVHRPILGNGKRRQTWLKRSLGTKELARANFLAKPVLIEFDRVLERAKALLKEQPKRHELQHLGFDIANGSGM
jgi:hypothetical protein